MHRERQKRERTRRLVEDFVLHEIEKSLRVERRTMHRDGILNRGSIEKKEQTDPVMEHTLPSVFELL